jgi:hypothetical protein
LAAYLCTPKSISGLEIKGRVGQSVKTPPFHGGMRGSTPLRGTQAPISRSGLFYFPSTETKQTVTVLKANTTLHALRRAVADVSSQQGFPNVS